MQALRARIGTTRLLLEKSTGTARRSLSTIQCNAVLEMMDKSEAQFSSEDRANLSDILMSAGFEADHLERLLCRLSSGEDVRRRKQQDHCAFLNYFSENEWAAMQDKDMQCTEIINKMVQVLMDRLDCINPSEPTKKLVASAALLISTPADKVEFISLETKAAMKQYCTKKFQSKKKARGIAVTQYCLKLPDDPAELLAEMPLLHKKALPEGGFCRCKLDSTKLHSLDSSFQCRNTTASAGSTLAVASQPAADMNGMMQSMMQQMMQFVMAQSQHRQSGADIDLQFMGDSNARGAKRSLKALAETNEERPVVELRRARTIQDGCM